MSTHKNIDKICVAVLVFTLLLTLLFLNGRRLGIEVVVDEDDEAHSGAVFFTKNDLDGSWDSSAATVITLAGDTASISGSGAYAHDGNVVISSAGLYVLSGALADGSIVVDAHNNSKVWLLFDGVDVACSDDACLRVDKADKVFLTLAPGSDNRLSGAVVFSDAASADGTDGVIYAHDDLTINGSGSLTVNAWYRHGIVAKDDLVITGGTITVTAQADGIRANDSLRLCGAAVTVEAGDDGVAVSGEGGYFYMESGSLAVMSEDDALKAVGPLTVTGGELALTPVGDGIRSDVSVSIAGGSIRIDNCYEGVEAPLIELSGGDVTIYPRDDGFNASAAGGETPRVTVSGGTLTIVNTSAQDADGIDSNGDVIVSGGVIRVSLPGVGTNNAIDCGSESGGVCSISGGSVIACGSANMAEGFDDSSSQCSIFYNWSASRAAGTVVSLTDGAGAELLSWEVPCSFSSLTLSVPELRSGESYVLRLGGAEETITLDGAVTSFGVTSGMGGGMPAMGTPPGDEPPAMSAPPGGGDLPEPPSGGFGGGMTPPDAPGAQSAPASEAKTASAVSAEQWLLVGAAALVLALGILLGVRYEPKE